MFVNPEKILDQLNLKDNLTACEFGCGSGVFTISIAKRLKNGRVFAIDILEEKITALKSKISFENLTNIDLILGNIEKIGGSNLESESVDIVFIPNVLFQNEDKKTPIEEAKRIVKKGGKIVIIDWQKNAPLGPKEGKISAEKVKEIAESIGLEFERELESGLYHYGLVFRK